MELNWELCRIFYQVARCRNFSRAAAMLFTSQPAVSRSMAALERELGCRLFIRNRRGVELTPEGRMFYAHVEAGCEQFRRGREELEQAVGLQSGSIALGASETALRHWLLPRLDRFHALYPGVRLRLFGGTSRHPAVITGHREHDDVPGAEIPGNGATGDVQLGKAFGSQGRGKAERGALAAAGGRKIQGCDVHGCLLCMVLRQHSL